jgi:hypothetical protein
MVMLKQMENNSERLSPISLVALIVATGIHHVFRLGPELILPSVTAAVLAVALIYLFRRTGRNGFAIAYAVLAGLVVLWFGILDGFFDHVLKSVGMENVTFLPGSEAAIVATVYQLWSVESSAAFYEGTGIVSAILALPTTIFTAMFLAQVMGSRPQRAA